LKHGFSKVEKVYEKSSSIWYVGINHKTDTQIEELMRDIILEAKIEGILMFNISHLEEHLQALTDYRAKRGKVYPLSMVLVLVMLAKLAGEDKPSGMASWIQQRKQELLGFFDVYHRRLPCLNTIRNILSSAFDVDEFAQILLNYLHQTYGGQTSRLVTIDGKTMRGTIPKGLTQGVHLLAVYLPEEGITLKQVAVGSKENEITACPALIEGIPLKNRIVCADAMQTQRTLSVKILAQGGDYIWIVKDNQPTLRADVEQFFKPVRHAAGWHIPELPRTFAQTSNKAHGRLERRQLTLMNDDQQFLDWPGVRQVFKVEKTVTQIKTNQTSNEVTYGITSCSPEKADAQQMLKWVRGYWGIENGLHYRRDVTLREDATRMSNPTMANAMATINNFMIGLTQKLGFSNLADARRQFGYKIGRQLLC